MKKYLSGIISGILRHFKEIKTIEDNEDAVILMVASADTRKTEGGAYPAPCMAGLNVPEIPLDLFPCESNYAPPKKQRTNDGRLEQFLLDAGISSANRLDEYPMSDKPDYRDW